MLTLRGHHLFCSLNYSGKGYTDDFIHNFDDFCARVTRGEAVRLTWQPDTICTPMIGQPGCHCHRGTIPVRDFFGFLMASITLGRWLFPPRIITLTGDDVERLRRAFRTYLVRPGCVGCPWFHVCTKTARAGNISSKLFPRHPS